jgi:hypothetical protein
VNAESAIEQSRHTALLDGGFPGRRCRAQTPLSSQQMCTVSCYTTHYEHKEMSLVNTYGAPPFLRWRTGPAPPARRCSMRMRVMRRHPSLVSAKGLFEKDARIHKGGKVLRRLCCSQDRLRWALSQLSSSAQL